MDSSEDVVLITGTGRGLGRAFAQAFAERGARVAITARSADALQRTVDELGQGPGRVLALQADVTDPDAAVRVIAAVEAQLGAIGVLINNAGQLRAVGPIGAVDPTLWWREIEVDLRRPFLYTHGVVPLMRSRATGRIINVVNGAGLFPICQTCPPTTSARPRLSASARRSRRRPPAAVSTPSPSIRGPCGHR